MPAIAERGRDVAVTAGAGAGKTRALVARYLALLAEGLPLRKVVAITFTKKAAREMRNRARATRSAATWKARHLPEPNWHAGKTSTANWTQRASARSTRSVPRSCAAIQPRRISIRGSACLTKGRATSCAARP